LLSMRHLVLFVCAVALLATESDDPFDPRQKPGVTERRLAGYTRPVAMLDLAPEIGGRLQLVGPVVGQRIAADGGPAVCLDPRLAELARAQSAAGLTAAEAGLAMRNAEADRVAREAELAIREAERQDNLGAAASASMRDNAHTNRARTQAAVAAATAATALAQADLLAARARHEESVERLARHSLVAPAGWLVVDRLLEPGAICAPGQAVLRLADVRTLVIPLRLDEAEISALRAVTQVPVRISGRSVMATLRRIDVTFDPVSRKRLAEIQLEGAALAEAAGGLPAELALPVPDPEQAMIPGTYIEWKLEQPWLRPAEGASITVPHLIRTSDNGIIVRTVDLPANLRLLPIGR